MIEHFSDIQEYQDYFRRLIEKERFAEKQFHLDEIKRLHGQERERRGRAILHLNAKLIGQFLDYKIYRFGRSKMPEHQISVGDIVLVSGGNPLRFNLEGTVSAVGNRFIEVMLSGRLFKYPEYRLDLFVNDITYQRMLQALEQLSEALFPVDILLGKRLPRLGQMQVFSQNLNTSQNKALSRALGSELFLVHGPPGTGKTTTLAEIIRASLGQKILVCADSNVAVDNLVEKFTDRDIVRIGHPARIDQSLMRYSLDVRIRRHQSYKKVEKLTRQIEQLRREQEERYIKPSPSKRRGYSDEEIIRMGERGKSGRGLSAKTMVKMSHWIKLQEKINSLHDKREKLTRQIADEILDKAEIIFATNSGAGSEFLAQRKFDVVFLDEAAQATEPSALIPLIRGKRVIMAGDHRQLPPTILARDAQDLSFTLFERFTRLYPEATEMLTLQYRMNDVICRFPSCAFYDCRLTSDSSVKDIVLSDIASEVTDMLAGDVPIVFYDTAGQWQEKQKSGSPSRYNPQEALFTVQLARELLKIGLLPQDIGIITPYKDHEEFIKKHISEVEVKSVDGFQGREKQVIIISLVRSNAEEQIGFLKDHRRINVAITRAKRKLIIVGDSTTISSDPLLSRLIEYIGENGKILQVN